MLQSLKTVSFHQSYHVERHKYTIVITMTNGSLRMTLGQLRAIIAERYVADELDMGDVVFGKRRTDVDSDEEDTVPEGDLYYDLKSWVRDYAPLAPTSVELLRTAPDDPRYADFVKWHGSGDVHRGMYVDKKTLARWLGIDPEELNVAGKMNTDMTLKPEGGLYGATKPLSFSKSIETAKWFADANSQAGPRRPADGVYAYFTADASVNSFIDLSHMQELTGGYMGVGDPVEEEVISVDPVRLTSVTWWLKRGD